MAKAKSSNELPVTISNPDKVFWPEEGYTKLDLARFYADVFPKLKPYVADRILTMERCPGGMSGPCFYQKEKPDSLPDNTPTKRIENASGQRKSTNYVVGGSVETQLALTNLGCIPIHVCGSRAKNFPKPDWVCFDIDPSSGKFGDAARAAVIVKEALDTLKLPSYVKTSGSRGVHIFVPIRVGPTADVVLRFAEEVVAKLAAEHPKELTVEHSIKARGQRVYLDPFRNGAVQTVVAPYSVRRKPHAPVSTPLSWKELNPKIDPAQFNLGNFAKRMKAKDPWADFFDKRANLNDALKRVKSL